MQKQLLEEKGCNSEEEKGGVYGRVTEGREKRLVVFILNIKLKIIEGIPFKLRRRKITRQSRWQYKQKHIPSSHRRVDICSLIYSYIYSYLTTHIQFINKDTCDFLSWEGLVS